MILLTEKSKEADSSESESISGLRQRSAAYVFDEDI